MDQKKSKNSSPRIKIIQKVYNSLMNPGVEIEYPKNQYKKFIKDVVSGTLERSDLIEETINIIIKIYNKLCDIPDRFKKSNLDFIDCIKTKTKKIENIDKKTCFILQLSQIPNINIKIAKIIAENHLSMKDFILTLNDWDNPIEYLEALPGIGTNKATKIVDFLL